MPTADARPAPAGVLIRALVAEGAVRVLLVEAHRPAEEARRRHGLGPEAAEVTARTMVAAALLSAYLKGEEQLTVQLQGSNPRLAVYVDQTATGDIRARTTPPNIPVAAPLHGVLVAIKSVHDKELYRGHTEVKGTVEQALAQHLGQSTQVDAILRVHARVDDDGQVVAASGLLLERLPDEPGQPSITVEAFDESYGELRSADPGALMTEMAFGRLQGEPLQILQTSPLTWQCRCSLERVRATLRSLGDHELQQMIDEDGGAEVTCHFCNEAYQLDVDDLSALLTGPAAS